MNTKVIILLLVLFNFSCQKKASFDVSIIQAMLLKENNCAIQNLFNENYQQWETSLDSLSNILPLSIPVDERNQMLQVRNAELIRMFNSYRALDNSGHAIINHAETKDFEIAEKIKSINQQNKSIQEKLDQFILSLNSNKQKDILIYKLDSISHLKCN